MADKKTRPPAWHYLVALLPFNFISAAMTAGTTCSLALGRPITDLDTFGWLVLCGSVVATLAALLLVACGFTSERWIGPT